MSVVLRVCDYSDAYRKLVKPTTCVTAENWCTGLNVLGKYLHDFKIISVGSTLERSKNLFAFPCLENYHSQGIAALCMCIHICIHSINTKHNNVSEQALWAYSCTQMLLGVHSSAARCDCQEPVLTKCKHVVKLNGKEETAGRFYINFDSKISEEAEHSFFWHFAFGKQFSLPFYSERYKYNTVVR